MRKASFVFALLSLSGCACVDYYVSEAWGGHGYCQEETFREQLNLCKIDLEICHADQKKVQP